ncbi:MOSC N-terminal beta barrel domain-containing protein [Simiduia curdlanivorans]|uniref:MOSC domain-containing protein n=1 Tax=Simiduia curdlanivorans TaxID=1492769 RepID=A0ABV8V901_9GAMM|nr:MOSC N-terminal beta barrel domain-containing protein [Simiduia curdlanivorans]MDN3639026.1 MOSC N-terminal beta barrel domain-containing protein [Simiduia curdlanivorans]
MMSIRVTDLFIYPVKSLRGIRLERAQLDIRGLEDDRRWMIIDDKNKFVTQRRLPAMALIQTQLTESHLILKSSQGECAIARQYAGTGTPFSATIWNDEVQVLDEGDAVSAWLSDALDGLHANEPNLAKQKKWRLVRLANQPRPMSKPQYLGAQTHTVFADMAPLLIANQASLDALNSALVAKGETPVPMNRFRPNLVITGLAAFAEHRLAGLAGQGYQIRFGYPCERCVMPSIDQMTAAKHPTMEPYITLRDINSMPAYGKGEYAKPANPKAAAFGENAYLAHAQSSLLLVGDTFQVLHDES